MADRTDRVGLAVVAGQVVPAVEAARVAPVAVVREAVVRAARAAVAPLAGGRGLVVSVGGLGTSALVRTVRAPVSGRGRGRPKADSTSALDSGTARGSAIVPARARRVRASAVRPPDPAARGSAGRGLSMPKADRRPGGPIRLRIARDRPDPARVDPGREDRVPVDRDQSVAASIAHDRSRTPSDAASKVARPIASPGRGTVQVPRVPRDGPAARPLHSRRTRSSLQDGVPSRSRSPLGDRRGGCWSYPPAARRSSGSSCTRPP